MFLVSAAAKQRTCGESEFRCDDGECILGYWQCDGEKDCIDESDEKPEVCGQCL